ncbi:MAG: hypothetical protein ACRDSZ_08270 [Pseudonocardiaceae bacterium]
MQCRKGWHLEAKPVADLATPSEEHKALLAIQANLVAAYAECGVRPWPIPAGQDACQSPRIVGGDLG